MQSSTITLRVISKTASELRRTRLLTFHLLHPEMPDDVLHSSRSMQMGLILKGFVRKSTLKRLHFQFLLRKPWSSRRFAAESPEPRAP